MNRQQRRSQQKRDGAPAPQGRMAAVPPLFAEAFGHHQAGRLDEAKRIYQRILAMDPRHADSLHMMGLIAWRTGAFDAAIDLIGKAIAQNGTVAWYHSNLSLALQEQGRWDEVLAACRKALALKPDLAEAHSNLGNALRELGRPEQAEASCREALALNPGLVEAHSNLGDALMEQGRLDEAIACYHAALALRPNAAKVYSNLGNTLKEKGVLDEAVAAYHKAIALNPGYAIAYSNLSVALRELGRMADAAAAAQQAIQHRPDFADGYSNMGLALVELGRLEDGVAAYRQALRLRPGVAETHANLAFALMELGRLDEAVGFYHKALDLKPDYAAALGCLVQQRRILCDWADIGEDVERVLEMVRRGRPGPSPFWLLSLPSTAAEQLACARLWGERYRTGGLALTGPACIRPRQRIRVGYLSADFRQHAVAYLLAELIERHDRDRFEVVGYSIGADDGGPMRQRLIAGFDRFVDLCPLSHRAAAERIAGDEIDILVDLQGYTKLTRTPILAYRPAPVQVNYLGYPGTMGVDFIDYIIADPVCIPAGHEAFYSEKVVRLPGCYQPNDTKRAIAEAVPSRAEHGLPDDGFVFCCFNASHKFTPEFHGIWMRLLTRVPGSVLWLLSPSDLVAKNLRREASACGIDPARLIFAPRRSLGEHLARHRLADLFLDTLPYNAHTTASDALWAGLPVLTAIGETFAGRVAASLLTAIGLPELIAPSVADYEEMAFTLATDRARLAELRAKLGHNRLTTPLFDIAGYTRHIEAAYRRMWDIACAGGGVAAFDISDRES